MNSDKSIEELQQLTNELRKWKVVAKIAGNERDVELLGQAIMSLVLLKNRWKQHEPRQIVDRPTERA